MLPVAQCEQTVLDVGHPLARQGMGTQIGRKRALCQSACRLQSPEKVHHPLWVETRSLKHFDASSVGLAFGVARKAEHLLHLHRRAERCNAHRRLRIRAYREQGCQQRGHRDR